MDREYIIKKATDLVCKYEGFSPRPYICPAGYKTIGYGERMFAGDTTAFISETLARERVAKKCEGILQMLLEVITPKLSNNQYAALISLLYNIGRTAFRESTLYSFINRQDHKEKITEQWMAWIKADGKPLKGLVERRKEEVELFFTMENNDAYKENS